MLLDARREVNGFKSMPLPGYVDDLTERRGRLGFLDDQVPGDELVQRN